MFKGVLNEMNQIIIKLNLQGCFPVYNGGIPETTKLLEEKFDHIFYTGSCNVGLGYAKLQLCSYIICCLMCLWFNKKFVLQHYTITN